MTTNLILIPIEKFTDEQSTAENNRLFNIDHIELKKNNQDFILMTDSGEIKLKENDELMIQGVLLRVRLDHQQNRLFEHFNEELNQADHQNDSNTLDIFSMENNEEEHPLEFLFNKKRNYE